MLQLTDMGKNVTRLYEQFQPENYDLTLDINRDDLTLVGSVTIRGRMTGRPSQRLTFHQKGLTITKATITKHDKKGDSLVDITRINNQDSYDEVRLHTDSMLYPGQYTVTLDFKTEITKPMHGLYPCFFKHDGQEKRLIASQFESHHAREAFPCIDEPEAKATFDLTLITPAGENEVVLANTPVKTKKPYTGSDPTTNVYTYATTKKSVPAYTKTTFETSPKMSTYLLAFVFGEMHGVEGKTKQGTLVRSWATIAQPKSHLQYANDEAIRCLEFFTDYFQTPFPLPKLDQVALPDFDSLAMENWGLVTYREVGLLADPDNRSISGEQLITLVVAHELSHQWFGNLVTMRWWDDLWLNESFASIMENIAPDRLHPDWQQWEDFITGRVLSCSHRDIYKDVQPVGVEVKQPDEIMTLFDPAIVYAKGARLLNMLYDYIGEDAFRAGLQAYFKQHAFTNTERDDLWQALGASSQHDIKQLMTPWLQQAGTPLVRVRRDGDKLQLTQQRFLMDGEDKESLWPIPLLADVALEPLIFEERELSIDYPASQPTPLFNVHGNAHYIVKYELEADRQRLQQAITDRSIDAISRVSVLNDMLLLARAGEYKLSDLLEIAKGCPEEPRDAVWSMFSRIISQAQTLTDGDEATEKQLKAFRRELASYWYQKLGWQDGAGDDPNTKHLRSTALALSISGESSEALDAALKQFEAAGGVVDLPAEQRAMISGVAVRFGKPEYIQQLMDEYSASHSPEVQQAVAAALCSSRDPKVTQRILKWGLSEDGAVRQQDIDRWFAYLMMNYRSRELAWQWLNDSWGYLAKLFGGSKHMEYFVWYSSGPLSTPEWEQRFHDFFEPKLDEAALKRNIEIGFGEIATRVAWRKREEVSLKAYFAKLSS